MKAFFGLVAALLFGLLHALPLRAEPDTFLENSAALQKAVDEATARRAAAVADAPLPAVVDPKDPRYFDSQIRAALLDRMKRNAVAARFALPTLESDREIRFDIHDETGTDNWAAYDHVTKVCTIYLHSANQDLAQLNAKHRGEAGWAPVAPLRLGQPLDARQIAVLTDRYLPVFVHEIGGHARHYHDLRALLGKDGANVYETELASLRLEAMTVTWERIARPDYLDDGTDYGDEQRRMADAFAKSFKKGDPGIFGDYLKKAFGNYDNLVAINSLSDEELRQLAGLSGRAGGDCSADQSSDACRKDLDTLRKYLPARGQIALDSARADYAREPKRTTFREAVLSWILRARFRTGDSAESLLVERDYFRKEEQLLDAPQSDFFTPSNLPDYPADDRPGFGGIGGRGRF